MLYFSRVSVLKDSFEIQLWVYLSGDQGEGRGGTEPHSTPLPRPYLGENNIFAPPPPIHSAFPSLTPLRPPPPQLFTPPPIHSASLLIHPVPVFHSAPPFTSHTPLFISLIYSAPQLLTPPPSLFTLRPSLFTPPNSLPHYGQYYSCTYHLHEGFRHVFFIP